MHRTAVIDNSTLVYLTKLKNLKIFDSLRFLFQQVHIPQEIKNEYEKNQSLEPNRVWILERLKPNYGFYSFCTRYDIVVLTMVNGKKDIDRGEAEVYAQQKKVNAHYIISDDIKFHKAIKAVDRNVKILTILHIIAMLDIRELLVNTNEIIKTLHLHYKFKSRQLRSAYIESANELGLDLPKSKLNYRCSFKQLGLN